MQESTSKPIRATDGDELREALDAHDRVLVEFYTKGCARCKAIEPVLGNVAREFDSRAGSRTQSDDGTRETGLTVVMVNPGNDISLVEEWSIRSVPTLVLVEDGEEVARLAEGFQGGDVRKTTSSSSAAHQNASRSEDAIEAFLDEHAN